MKNNTAAIIANLHETYIKKNHDYGNSFDQSLNEDGLIAAKVRIGDKVRRIQQLMNGKEQMVNDESVIDTLLDLANYCVMTRRWQTDEDIAKCYRVLDNATSDIMVDNLSNKIKEEGVKFIPKFLSNSYKEMGIYLDRKDFRMFSNCISSVALSSIIFVNYLNKLDK